jgi:hypothetical protein
MEKRCALSIYAVNSKFDSPDSLSSAAILDDGVFKLSSDLF